MYNGALDMRDAGNKRVALALLQMSLAVILVLADTAEPGDESQWQAALTHDALKRVSLGFRLVPEENLLEQGALVSVQLLICHKVARASQVCLLLVEACCSPLHHI